MHGDQFDVVVAHAKWLAHVGDWAYRAALRLNIAVNWVRRRMGLTYWSLSAWAKHKVKNAVSVIGRFEEALTLEARDSGADGVICGHIHYADMHEERLGHPLRQHRRLGRKLHRGVRDQRGRPRTRPLDGNSAPPQTPPPKAAPGASHAGAITPRRLSITVDT